MPTLQQASSTDPRHVLLVEMLLSSAPLRVCSRSTTLTWAGQEWLGLGVLGTVGQVTDGGGELGGLSFTLSGVPQDEIALARAEAVRGKPVRVYLGGLGTTDDTMAWCDRVWSGVLDAMTIVDDGSGGAQVEVTAEHRGQALRRHRVWLYSDADQRRLTATTVPGGDDSLRLIADQAQRDIVWPARAWFQRRN